MFYKEDWNEESFGSIKKTVKFALDKKNMSGHDSIVSSLLHISDNSISYWLNIAEELCRENLYWDAIDCWQHAKEIEPDNKVHVLLDMAESLDHKDDFYLRDIATQAYLEISKIKPTQEVWQLLASRTTNKDQILNYLEKALDFGEDLDWKDVGQINVLNLSPNCNTEEIVNYVDLGDVYLWNDQLDQAFKCFTKAIKYSIDKEEKIFCSIIFNLNSYAKHKNFSIESFIPDSIFLSINEDEG